MRCAHCFHGEAWNTPGEKGRPRSALWPTRFDERLLVRACTARIIPRLAGYSQRILSLREAIEVEVIGYYSDIVAIKRGAFLCSDTRQIARSNYRLLDIKRRIRWAVRSAKAINGSRISQAGSDNWIERFFSSLHKRSSTLFLPIPSRDPATCYFDPLLDLFARIYSFLPSP